jgi:hypothetical protein
MRTPDPRIHAGSACKQSTPEGRSDLIKPDHYDLRPSA